MKSSKLNLPVDALATLADINRLWSTLTIEYIPGLRIELIPVGGPDGHGYIVAELVDYGGVKHPVLPERSVWARRRFQSPLYLISHTQLFDLLISGYRVIDAYFDTGVDNRPSSLKD